MDTLLSRRPVPRRERRTTKKSEAERLLRLREGDVARGLPVSPKIGQLRFDEAAEDVVNDYRVNGKRSLNAVERRIRLHLRPYFGGRRMVTITTSDVRAYVAKRQADTIVVRQRRPTRRQRRSRSATPGSTAS